MRSISILTITALLLTSGCSAVKNQQKMHPTKDINIEQFMGTWYEIARFPHRFERNLVGVTANYKLNENGKVEVINKGHKHTLDGKVKKAKAFAKIPNPEETGRLKVYFFWPFGADYLILDIDEEYTWALVGSSSPDYLWILSRTAQLPHDTYQKIVQKAKSIGYDINKLEIVKQKENQ
ncbi:MAG: lipocalin family protein [Bacteroidales bacterium]